jgi:hypothetical protein
VATAVERRNANARTGNVDGDAIEPRQIRRRHRHESGDAPERADHAKATADQREKKRFGEKLTDQPSAPRPEGATHSALALAHGRLRR